MCRVQTWIEERRTCEVEGRRQTLRTEEEGGGGDNNNNNMAVSSDPVVHAAELLAAFEELKNAETFDVTSLTKMTQVRYVYISLPLRALCVCCAHV